MVNWFPNKSNNNQKTEEISCLTMSKKIMKNKTKSLKNQLNCINNERKKRLEDFITI